MFKISVCLLTYNSSRLLREVLKPFISIADEIIIVDAESHDKTINIPRGYGFEPIYQSFNMHGEQMNHATGLANHLSLILI